MSKRTNLYLVATAVAVLAAVFVIAGCGSSSSATSTSSTPTTNPAAAGSPAGGGGGGGASVTIQNFAFTPATLTVSPGANVTWTNKDSVPHDVTSTDGPGISANTTSTFASGTMSTGQTFSFTFSKAGTYFYECSIHAGELSMHAKVVVK